MTDFGQERDDHGEKVDFVYEVHQGEVPSDPKTLSEYLARIGKAAAGLPLHVAELALDVVKAARAFVVGLGNLPGALARRVKEGRKLATEPESTPVVKSIDCRELSGDDGKTKDAMRKLQDVVEDAGGKIKRLQSGEILIVLGKPDAIEAGLDLVDDRSAETATPDDDATGIS